MSRSPFSPFPLIYTTLVIRPPFTFLDSRPRRHGVNDGWRKRKETTHGESERETDERLDQDMRKDDEEPRAARE